MIINRHLSLYLEHLYENKVVYQVLGGQVKETMHCNFLVMDDASVAQYLRRDNIPGKNM